MEELSSQESEEIASVFTPKLWGLLIILIIVTTLISLFDGLFTAWSPWYNALSNAGLGTVPHTSLGPSGPIVYLLVIWFIMAMGGRKALKLKPQHLAILFAAVLMSFLHSGYPKWVLFDMAVGPLYMGPEYVPFVPEGLWTAPKAVFDLSLPGGAPVPWGDWTVPIAYWITWSIVIFLFGLAWASLSRRRWVDIAMLPYPYGTVVSEPITLSTTEQPSRRVKLVAIAALLNFLFYVPVIVRKLLPWFPDVYGFESWPFVPWHMGSLDTTVASPALASALAGDFMWNVNPFWYAIFYLSALDVTFTVWVGWLIFLVIMPQIAMVAGTLPSPFPIQSHNRVGTFWNTSPIHLASIGIGMFAGLLIFELVVHRRYYIDTFKASSEREKNEPIPYKMAWLMLLVSFVILVGMLLAAGSGISGGLFAIAGIFVYMVGFSYMYGETGVMEGTDFADKGAFWWVLYQGQEEMTQEWYVSGLIYGHGINDALMAGTAGYLTATFKVARETNTHPKDILKALVSSVVLTNLIAVPLIVWSIYTFGHTKIPVRCHGCYACVFTPYAYVTTSPPLGESWPWVILGVVLMGATMYLRAVFPWFPFNPVGFLLLQTGTLGWLGIAIPALVAWVLKNLTIRVGGTRAYDEIGKPLAIGILLGFGAYAAVYGGVSIYRWFVPT
ncbi:MAG: DUF6785 family protein [Candidatus Bathyarchaeia archaeon]